MRKKLTIFLLALSGLAEAGCYPNEYIDLRASYPKAFKNIEIKNQGSYGLCYAYAGAMMIDFNRMTQYQAGTSEISALQAGLLSSIHSESESEEGGDICDVVNAVSKKGSICSDSTIGRELAYKGLGEYFHAQVVQQVFMPFILREQEFKAVTPKQFTSRIGLNKVQKAYVERFDAFYRLLKIEILKRGIVPANVPSALHSFKLAQNIHVNNRYSILGASFMESIINELCPNSAIKVPPMHCRTAKGSAYTLIGDLDHQISSLKPVGISYCSIMLTNREETGLDYTGAHKKNCGEHASVIIGRKSDKLGRCSYLIRNSWGESSKYDWETSKGDIWVSEHQLKRNLFQVHVIE